MLRLPPCYLRPAPFVSLQSAACFRPVAPVVSVSVSTIRTRSDFYIRLVGEVGRTTLNSDIRSRFPRAHELSEQADLTVLSRHHSPAENAPAASLDLERCF